MSRYSIFPSGDQAITLSFGNEITEEYHQRVLMLEQVLKAKDLPGIRDIIVAYSSITLRYDASEVYSVKTKRPFVFWRDLLEKLVHEEGSSSITPRETVRIPVCYEGEFAPDMAYVCNTLHLTSEEVIYRHSAAIYTVFVIGFLPGFPYMGTVDEHLRISRKETPSKLIEAGSVGLAGMQTGVYPLASPGGWQIIGRTPVLLFDKRASIPALLSAGDRVQFFPISKSDFITYEHTRS